MTRWGFYDQRRLFQFCRVPTRIVRHGLFAPAFAQLIGLALLGISPVERVRVLPPLPLRVCMK